MTDYFVGHRRKKRRFAVTFYSLRILLANRRFFLLFINYIPVIPSVSEGSPSLFLHLTKLRCDERLTQYGRTNNLLIKVFTDIFAVLPSTFYCSPCPTPCALGLPSYNQPFIVFRINNCIYYYGLINRKSFN